MYLLKRIKLTMISENQEKDASVVKNSWKEVEHEQALFDAAASGDCVKIANLLSLGISVEAKSFKQGLYHSIKHSMTPLQIATINEHLNCIQMLINHGANVNAKSEFGCTALHLAAKSGNYLCLKALLEAGADSCAHIDMPLYRPDAPYVGNTTPLHLAAENDYPNCIEELIRFGADCNAANENGQTSLFIAARAGFKQCVLTLLRHSHGLACLSLPSNDTSDTPLHHAIKNRMVECIKEMVHLGSDVNHINKYGFSPLQYLLFTHGKKSDIDMEILKCLVLESCNTDINTPSPSGDTALDFVLSLPRDEEMAVFLITYGAVVNSSIQPLLLEYELAIASNLDILKCLVKSMPQLPRLKSLNHSSGPTRKLFGDDDSIEKEFILTKIKTEMYVKVIRPESDFIQARLGWKNIPPPYMYVLYPFQQPVLDIIYERVIEKLEQIKYLCSKRENDLLILQKQLWYEQMASKPPTLQHCCRFSIRKCMGPSRLKHISKLPLPQKMQSYLLFKCDE